MSESVLVVGAGLVGGLIALRLAEAGCRVRVLDRERVGAEASSAAAGILAGQSEARSAGAAFELGLESRALHAALFEEFGATGDRRSGYRQNGALAPTTDRDHEAAVASHGWQRAQGLRVEALDARSLRELAPGLNPRFSGGVFFPDDASVDPAGLMSSVASALERRGVSIVADPVHEVTTLSGRVTGVRTALGRHDAPIVVLCAGAWSSLVGGALPDADAIVPARGQLKEFAVDPVPFGPVIYSGGGYLVPRVDGRVCVGSTMERVGFERGTTPAGLRTLHDRAADAVPILADARVIRAWSNFRPCTPDGLPLVGELDVAGLYVAAGHHRSGILLAPVTADIVRDLIVHRRRHRHLDALRPDRFRKSLTS